MGRLRGKKLLFVALRTFHKSWLIMGFWPNRTIIDLCYSFALIPGYALILNMFIHIPCPE